MMEERDPVPSPSTRLLNGVIAELAASSQPNPNVLVELDSIMIDGAKAGMAAFATANGAIMRDGSGLPITPLSSLACFYWWNRHTITQSAEVQETTRFIDLEAARKL